MSRICLNSHHTPPPTIIIVLILLTTAVVLSGCTDSALPASHPAIDADSYGVAAMQNTEADLDAALQSGKPVVVYFNEVWCSKCKDQAPIIESINMAVGDQAVIVVLDREKNPQVASGYNITIAPNMLIFDGEGNVVSTGYMGSEKLASFISVGATETNNEIDEKMNL